MTITSLDFETANYSRVSICAAGMAVFVDGNLTESPYWLVRPPKGHGWFREDFIECHHFKWPTTAWLVVAPMTAAGPPHAVGRPFSFLHRC